jgi:hypothetical protein
MKAAMRKLMDLAFATTSAPALAQSQQTENAWRFEATPYLWAAGINGWGRIGAQAPTVKIDENFSDVFRNLDIGAMGAFEARKGRWAIIFDSFYVKLSAESEPLAGGALGTAHFGMKEAIFQLAGAYRVYDHPVTPVDLVVGARYTYLSGDLSFSDRRVVLPGGGGGRSDNANWTDGFVGVRAMYAVTARWSLVGYADAGAGGTKHSWQFLASTNYKISKTVVAKLGYRIISMDYEKPGFLYNVKTSGFFAGIGIVF